METRQKTAQDISTNAALKSRKVLKTLTKKHPGDLLLVIGTGVSAAVAPGIPALRSWRSCIEAVIDAAEQLEVLHPRDVAEFRWRVQTEGDLLVVAHDLISKMSRLNNDSNKPSFYQDCLMEVFDNLEDHMQNPIVLDSILRLMERGAMVLTTNYDTLLETYGQSLGRPMESINLHDKVKVLQWARGQNKYGVLHIHGLYTDPCGMVLDPFGYKDITQDIELVEVLQNLYLTKSFLFLGCGETLRVQIFQSLLLYTVQYKVGLEHYMLVLKDNEDYFFKLQADMLLVGIKLMSYGNTYDRFPDYFKGLSSQLCNQGASDVHTGEMSPSAFEKNNEKPAKRKMEENAGSGKTGLTPDIWYGFLSPEQVLFSLIGGNLGAKRQRRFFP